MNFEIGSIRHGFRLLGIEDLEEVESKVHLFEHVQSGAPLLYLSCEDDNKVFSIAFRTPPTDDTGIAHIMEHSVLCGSEKFPTKEPFVDLLKGSLQTFLNAFTSSDRTVYPVASRNDKDFLNLMDVYLDAVFFPLLKTTPEILMQEGWHYEIQGEGEEERLVYNGIVYNEMKGAFSSPTGRLSRVLGKRLYPDGTYSKESGGEPDAIPQLTQERFVAFHETFYHPSNALIFLYGSGAIGSHLEFLDREYLRKFHKKDVRTSIVLQPPFEQPREFVEEYSVNPGDATANKTFLTLNYLIGNAPDAEMHYAMNLLSYILVDSQASPIRRALIEAGVGVDIAGSWDNSVLQPCFSIMVYDSDPEQKELFVSTVLDTLAHLAKNGLDPRLVEGAINRMEFSLREFQIAGYPKGLAVNMQLLDSWTYGADPLMYLRFEPILKKIRAEVSKGYFETLIRKNLLENTSRATIVMRPKAGLDQENDKTLAETLARIKTSLSPERLQAIRDAKEKLLKRQAAPNRPEDVAKIPTLKRSDINPKAEDFPIREFEIENTTFLNHDVETNKIVYLNAYFDAASLPDELVPYAALLSDILAHVDTERFTYGDLTSEIDIHTGGIGTGFSPISGKDSLDVFYPRYSFGTKTTIPKLEKGLELILEIMLRSRFDDTRRIREILQENRSGMEQHLIAAGHSFAQLRAASYFSPLHAYREKINGLSYYRFLLALENDFEQNASHVRAKLETTAKRIFNRNAMLVSVTLPEKDFLEQKPVLSAFARKIPVAEFRREPVVFVPDKRKEGVVIPSQVQYVAKSGDFRRFGVEYSGKMNVLSHILRTGYLWNRIRVQGGAYGSGVTVDRNGLLSFMSYRDPHLSETIEVYDRCAEYLEHLELSELELTNAIIATSGAMDRPTTPAEKGSRAAVRYIVGLTREDIQRERDEALSTTLADLRGFSSILRGTMEQDNLCVFGGEEKIKEAAGLFDHVVRINP